MVVNRPKKKKVWNIIRIIITIILSRMAELAENPTGGIFAAAKENLENVLAHSMMETDSGSWDSTAIAIWAAVTSLGIAVAAYYLDESDTPSTSAVEAAVGTLSAFF